MDKPESQVVGNPRRKILSMAVSSILLEKGFETVDKACLESLTEMMQSYLDHAQISLLLSVIFDIEKKEQAQPPSMQKEYKTYLILVIFEIGQSSRNYCELSGRTIPVVGDVVVALVNMGISLQGIESFGNRNSRQVIPVPQQVSAQKQLNLLQAGTKSSHPPHIPSYLPVLPDPHAYIRTPTHKQPVTEYEAIREKAANQKRDVEKALTKFLSKTSETHSLFDTEDNMFPLIACKSSFPPYLAALNPTDQVFDFEELEYHYQVANRTEDVPSKDNENESGNEDENDEKLEKEIKTEAEPQIKPNSTTNNAILNNPNIDNPYLRAATLPKKTKPTILI